MHINELETARVAVAALFTMGHRIFLVKRNSDLMFGKWCLPGGIVGHRETTEEAIKREVLEEIGVEIQGTHQVFGIYTDVELSTVVVVYIYSMPRQTITPSLPEIADARWFTVDNIPWAELAFSSTIEVVKEYFGVDPLKCDHESIGKRIAIDFDGVIADISNNYAGPGKFGPVIPGAKNAFEQIKRLGWKIIVYTGRSEIGEIKKYLVDNNLPFDEINFDYRHPKNLAVKILADIYLDDKSLKFDGNWPNILSQIEEFEVWYRPSKRGSP